MRAKWIVALFMAVALCCGCLTGLAEVRSTQVEAYRIEPAIYSDVLIMIKHTEDGNSVTYLAAVDGTILSDGYDNISEVEGLPLFNVTALEPEDINCKGLISADGSVALPPTYADVKVCNDRWWLAFKTVRTSGEEYDYYNWFGTDRYLIDTVDIYYRGGMVGSVMRDDYIYANAYGDYLCLQDRKGTYTFYNKALEKTLEKTTDSYEYAEKYTDDAYVFYHLGSGVQAFCEGCPLTEDEVQDRYVNHDGKIWDLQGNVVYETPEGSQVSDFFPSRYARIERDGKYGVVDLLTGGEILPVEYDNVEYFDSDVYAVVQKDGMFGYVRKGGEAVCDYVYPYDEVERYYRTVSTVKNPEGGVTVISSIAGILPEQYKDVQLPRDAHAFVAENDAGQKALIGLNGKVLIPFADYDTVEVNLNATVAVTRDAEETNLVWTMDAADAVE